MNTKIYLFTLLCLYVVLVYGGRYLSAMIGHFSEKIIGRFSAKVEPVLANNKKYQCPFILTATNDLWPLFVRFELQKH